MKRGGHEMARIQMVFCVLKTRTLENYTLGFAYHFKLQACDAVRTQIGRFSRTRKPRLRYFRLCCDACNVHVVWSDQYSSSLSGPHRDTTSSLPFEGPKRGNTDILSVPEALVFTVLLYTLIPLFLLCFTVLSSSPTRRKKILSPSNDGHQHLIFS